MATKRTPTRFTIQFNDADPRARAVADLLNDYGRKKAQFIIDAILHFTNCAQTPEEHLPDTWRLEQIVRLLVAEEMRRQDASTPAPAQPPPIPKAAAHSVTIARDENLGVSDQTAALISDALSAFRLQG